MGRAPRYTCGDVVCNKIANMKSPNAFGEEKNMQKSNEIVTEKEWNHLFLPKRIKII